MLFFLSFFIVLSGLLCTLKPKTLKKLKNLKPFAKNLGFFQTFEKLFQQYLHPQFIITALTELLLIQ